MTAQVPANFKFDLLRSPQAAIELQCQEAEEDEVDYDQYEIKDLRWIWYRVVCVNRIPGKTFKGSLLGPTGHLERASVWVHLLAAMAYLIHSIVRYTIYGNSGEKDSLSNRLVTTSSIALVFTFVISSTYHVYSANAFYSAVTRQFDYFGIYLSIGASYAADLSISTLNMKDIPAQAYMDLWFAMALMVGFFGIRRLSLTVSETRMEYFNEKCGLGLARRTNADLEHSSLRASAGFIMALSWILCMPLAFKNIESDSAGVLLWSHIIGTVILILGMALDNILFFPDEFVELNMGRRRCLCYSDREGCGGGFVFNSHALWHVVSFAATVSTTIGLEYVIAGSEALYTR